MNLLLVGLRIVHVGLGVFWAGGIFFMVFFLEPAVRGAGPPGGAVMAGLQQRRLMSVMPTVALLTILTGLWLYVRLWGPAMGTPAGMTFGAGGVAALAAFLLGWFVMRPAQMAAGVGAARLQGRPEGPERAAAAAEIDRLRRRARTAARWIAALLALAVITMAVGRYV